ncbi:MAG: hypothetical protein GF333_02700 [Candidatus Omnitrophica bacterium]|nr:hypothetical protein [Candidatus Omnitrophota bacterium]
MRKGIVFVVVLGILIVVSSLAFVILMLLTQESRVAEYKIRRMRAFYAAQAGKILALEQLRKGNWTYDNSYTICPSAGGGCDAVDPDIAYEVDVDIHAQGHTDSGAAALTGTTQIDVSVDY